MVHANSSYHLIGEDQIQGTIWSVVDKTARNAIPYDKRKVGMLVTWIESSQYVTERYEGTLLTDPNWQNDSNWKHIIDESDTLNLSTYSLYADTADIAFDAYYADTSIVSLYSIQAEYSDTADFALYADTSNYAIKADSSIYVDTALYVKYITDVDSILFNDITDTIHTKGSLNYDNSTQTLIFQNDIEGFNHNLGYELVVRVYNQTGSQIDNGTPITLENIYKNGQITPTIKKAGNSTLDSLVPIGMTTVDIPDASYGIVTMIGSVKIPNTAIYGGVDTQPIYVGKNGTLTITKPVAPDYALRIGYIGYSDNDSGSIYIKPLPPELDPVPHFVADTSNISSAVTINTQNVYEYLPFSLAQERDNAGMTIVGDSVQVQVAGHYNIFLGMSFNGNPTTEIWRYGIFVGGKPAYTKSRSTSSSATGDVNVSCYRYIAKNTWISFKIRNQSSTGDPTIVDINFNIQLFHE